MRIIPASIMTVIISLALHVGEMGRLPCCDKAWTKQPSACRKDTFCPDSRVVTAGYEAPGVPGYRVIVLHLRVDHRILEVCNLPDAVLSHHDE